MIDNFEKSLKDWLGIKSNVSRPVSEPNTNSLRTAEFSAFLKERMAPVNRRKFERQAGDGVLVIDDREMEIENISISGIKLQGISNLKENDIVDGTIIISFHDSHITQRARLRVVSLIDELSTRVETVMYFGSPVKRKKVTE